MNIFVWILFGAIAGWIASIIMGRNAQMGAIIGGFIVSVFGSASVTGFNLYSMLVAVLGAVVLLFVTGLFRRA